MMSLSCKDMGATDCNFKAMGNSAQEVKDKMMDHVMRDHKDMMGKMSEEEKKQMMIKMDKMIKA